MLYHSMQKVKNIKPLKNSELLAHQAQLATNRTGFVTWKGVV